MKIVSKTVCMYDEQRMRVWLQKSDRVNNRWLYVRVCGSAFEGALLTVSAPGCVSMSVFLFMCV